MLLSYLELLQLVSDKVIAPVPLTRVNAASIDLTLGDTLLIEWGGDLPAQTVDLAARPRQYPQFGTFTMKDDGYVVPPGGFLLATTVEHFRLPNTLALDFRLTSSLARGGLNAALANWGDPGWHDAPLTLELKNWTKYHPLRLRPGMKIGQALFFRVATVPDEFAYGARGSYNECGTAPTLR